MMRQYCTHFNSDYLIECSTIGLHGLFCSRVFLFVCCFCFLHIEPCCGSNKYAIICSSIIIIIIIIIINSNYMHIFINITGVDLLPNAVRNSHLRANRMSPRINMPISETVVDFAKTFGSTVVPVMNGHPRDQAKVSVHDRWPLIAGTGGRRQT